MPSNQAAKLLAGYLYGRFEAFSTGTVSNSPRMIVVLGAGASNAACGLDTGAKLASKVRAQVATGIPVHLVENEIARLSQVYRLEKNDFETILLALSKFDRDGVRAALRYECGIAHYPSFGYELLAHLMKHGFLDAIINFNFDELLDDAIEGEVGPDGYHRFVHDGDWAMSLRPDSTDIFRFDRPLYIKPHGTVSEPESLRFTREAYYELPPEMGRLLQHLMSGSSATEFSSARRQGQFSDGAEGNDKKPVCVIVLGHALDSFEFNNFLAQCPAGSSLYVTEWGNESISLDPKIGKLITLTNNGNRIKLSQTFKLENFLESIWSEILCLCESNHTVRGIHRHKLVAELFKPNNPLNLKRRESAPSNPSDLELEQKDLEDKRKALVTYFRDRFLVETMLAIAKSKGFIDVRELNRGRAGRYYQELRRLADPKILNECAPIEDYLTKFGMENRDPWRESYWHKRVAKGNDLTKRLTMSKREFGCSRNEIMRNCISQLSKNRWTRLKNNHNNVKLRDLVVETLDAMFNGPDVEVVRSRARVHQFTFQNAKPIRSYAHLQAQTEELLSNGWDMLLCVAESGEWLTKRHAFQERQLPVAAIVAEKLWQAELKKMHVKVSTLPWYDHNRHMTITLEKNKAKNENELKFVPVGAIYFERRQRTSLITPYVLTNEVDLERALDDFTIYWLKSEAHAAGKSSALSISKVNLKTETIRMLECIAVILEGN